MTHSFPVYT